MVMEQPADIPLGGLRPPGFGNPPVKDWWGVLKGWQLLPGFGGDVAKPTAIFSFVDAEIIASDTPWGFPSFDIQIKKSGTGYVVPEEQPDGTMRGGGSQWGYYANSVLALGLISLNQLVGKRQHWVRDDDVFYYTGGNSSIGYRVIEVEGIEKPVEVPPEEYALTMLDGLTEVEFYQAAVPDSYLQEDPEIYGAIMDKTFIADRLESGAVTVDKHGVYHIA